MKESRASIKFARSKNLSQFTSDSTPKVAKLTLAHRPSKQIATHCFVMIASSASTLTLF